MSTTTTTRPSPTSPWDYPSSTPLGLSSYSPPPSVGQALPTPLLASAPPADGVNYFNIHLGSAPAAPAASAPPYTDDEPQQQQQQQQQQPGASWSRDDRRVEDDGAGVAGSGVFACPPRVSTQPAAWQPPAPGGLTPIQRAETSPAVIDHGGVRMVDPHECVHLLSTLPRETLLLDVRPSPQYAQARIRGALNLCIPTTLLKRPSFNLRKVEDMFGNEHLRAKLRRWRSSSHIVAYDGATSDLRDASTLISVLKKFSNESWQGRSLVLRGGFSRFASEFSDWVEPRPLPSPTAPTHHHNQQQQQQHQQAEEDEEKEKEGQQHMHRKGKRPFLSLSSRPDDDSGGSIGLALPGTSFATGSQNHRSSSGDSEHTNPMHRSIRQNIELIDGGVGQLPVKVPAVMTDDNALKSMPQWLQRASDGYDQGKMVSEKFLAIEKAERSRMQEALADGSQYNVQFAEEKCCRIAGIEKGLKNRYSNVYPYDHSRVRLQNVPKDACDYVNASHVHASRSNKQYIATQAPLPATFHDFWRVVWEQDIRVIVMLTAEAEGAQLKCHPYWNSGDYGQLHLQSIAERKIPLDEVDQSKGEEGQVAGAAEDQPPCMTVRHLTLSHTAQPFEPIREVTQLQYTHWPDFLAPASQSHLPRLVAECNRMSTATITTESGIEPEPEGCRKVLVHCSAGCGRTGTFCTVDSVIDMLKRQRRTREQQRSTLNAATASSADNIAADDREDWQLRDDVDLVASTVEDFRTQRPSMVQSLRQFVLCYETVLEWLAQERAQQQKQIQR